MATGEEVTVESESDSLKKVPEERINSKIVSETVVSETVMPEEIKALVPEVVPEEDLDPFGPKEGECYTVDPKWLKRQTFNTSRVGYRGWKDAYMKDEDKDTEKDGTYYRIDFRGVEVEYDGSLDSDPNWNRQFWTSSSGEEDEDEDEVSSKSLPG